MKTAFESFQLEIFGESHSQRIGMRMCGLPKGGVLTLSCVNDLLRRRSPSDVVGATDRRENDEAQYVGLSKRGEKYIVEDGNVTAYLSNMDIRSEDYADTITVPRPSHADFAAYMRDGKISAGGGRFSGRMTAPLCIAGGIAKEFLLQRKIYIDAYITEIGNVRFLSARDSDALSLRGLSEEDRLALRQRALPTLSDDNLQSAVSLIESCAEEGDSVGGVIECIISGVKAGEIGDALFEGLEGKLAYALYGVPAVKGVEFGDGFAMSGMKGSVANDPIGIVEGKPCALKNGSGGINGGISNGMPIVLRVAIKPTPSVAKPQNSVDLATMRECSLQIKGRHDTCIVPRAVPAIEAACSLAIFDEMKKRGKI